MAYSRWSGSVWYAFYNTSSGFKKHDQVLSLWYSGSDNNQDFEYHEFRKMSDEDIKVMVKSRYKGMEVTDEELSEAVDYVRMFMEDVEEDYGTHGRKA